MTMGPQGVDEEGREGGETLNGKGTSLLPSGLIRTELSRTRTRKSVQKHTQGAGPHDFSFAKSDGQDRQSRQSLEKKLCVLSITFSVRDEIKTQKENPEKQKSHA